MIVVGADHGGWALAQQIVRVLEKRGLAVENLLPVRPRSGDDYPLIAHELAKKVRASTGAMGIAVCRTGVGMAMVANKVSGVRAVAAQHAWQATGARRDEQANVLSLAADKLTLREAMRIVDAFLTTPYKKVLRFERRLKEIRTIERRGR